MRREGHWIFGYGSLVWRPDFAYAERRPARIAGYARRFWQASPDHRGTPEAPGRVATLVPQTGAHCGGVAYLVEPAHWDEVLCGLDLRESGGFDRVEIALEFCGSPSSSPVTGLTYVAAADNPNYRGPAAVDEIAAQVRRCRGRSGSNLEYVLRLDDALRALGLEDPHLDELAARLRAAQPA